MNVFWSLAAGFCMLAALACVFMLAGPREAFACPPGTVFSAYNGSGLCLRPGGGATDIVVRCSVTVGNYCPAGTTLHKKKSDPKHAYCCQTKRYEATFDKCVAQCKPLLTAVKPEKEAERVYGNCRELCRGTDTYECPPDKNHQIHRVKNGQKCPQ